jgi:hypothetical protein
MTHRSNPKDGVQDPHRSKFRSEASQIQASVCDRASKANQAIVAVDSKASAVVAIGLERKNAACGRLSDIPSRMVQRSINAGFDWRLGPPSHVLHRLCCRYLYN